MTKKQFFNMLRTSTLDEKIKNEYLMRYENLLSVVDPKINLDVNILQNYESKNRFEYFIREHNEADTKELLNEIYVELQDWVSDYISLNTTNTIDTMSKMSNITKNLLYKNELDKKREHKRRIIFIVFIVLFCIFSLLVAIFSILEICEAISFGVEIASICGVLDFINGALFFVLEKIDDMKKQKMDDHFDNNLTSGNGSINFTIGKVDNRTIKIKKVGNGNTIINGDVKKVYDNESIDLDKLLFPNK